MTLYLDTSVLVSALTHEAASERTRAWLGRQAAGDLIISDWVVTEVSSALAIKLRTKAIDENQRADALAGFRRLAEIIDDFARRSCPLHGRRAPRRSSRTRSSRR